MYLVETIKQTKDGFDVTRDSYDSEKEARARFWYLVYLHYEDVLRYYSTSDVEQPKGEDVNTIMYSDENFKVGSINFEIL